HYSHVGFGVGFVDLDITGFDDDPSASGHGIAGIYRQVHNGLLDVVRIGLDVAGIRAQAHHELDVFSDQAAQHAFGLPDHRVEVDDAQLHDLAAAEGEQLIGQRGGPIRCFENLFRITAQRVQGRKLIQDHPVVACDYGEHIVEVVRHAAGQAAHGLHLLRLRQLCFQGLTQADITDEGDPEDPFFGFDAAQADLHRKLRAVLAPTGEIEADTHGASPWPLEVILALPAVGRSL